MAQQPIDLLQVALAMDPRFGQGMPQEVADAFAAGDVTRIFRTSSTMAPQSAPRGQVPSISVFPGQNKQAPERYGDYTGSIYVQTKNGRTARFKSPELSMGEDAGWNANGGKFAFFENSGFYTDDAVTKDAARKAAAEKGRALTVNENNRLRIDASTPLNQSSGSQILGKNVIEYSNDRRHTHGGHQISDVFESTGERHYFDQPDASSMTRGQASVEPISKFMARKGVQVPAPTVEVKDKAKDVSQNVATKPTGKPAVSSGEEADDTADEGKGTKEEPKKEEPKTPASEAKDKAKEVATEPVKGTVESKAKDAVKETLGVKGGKKSPEKKPKDPQAEEENVADKAGEKIQDKVVDTVKEKVQDKAKEVLGDPKKGKEELADIIIDAVNKTNANKTAGVAVGQKATQVSTTVAGNANVPPLVVSHPNASAAANAAPKAIPQGTQAAASTSGTQAAKKMASSAGKGTPPATAVPSGSTVAKGEKILDELMTYGRDLSSAVFKGAKESKNIRMLGLAALAGATGWAVGKNKDAKKAQEQEFNRQQAIRQSLMSDG